MFLLFFLTFFTLMYSLFYVGLAVFFQAINMVSTNHNLPRSGYTMAKRVAFLLALLSTWTLWSAAMAFNW